MIITDKIKEWAAIIGSLLLAIVTFGLYARSRGEAAQEVKTENAQAQADVAKADTQQVESRDETNAAVNNLPEAPAQTVGNADPKTAAGQLDSGGWTRD
jgi:hypothetical protein